MGPSLSMQTSRDARLTSRHSVMATTFPRLGPLSATPTPPLPSTILKLESWSPIFIIKNNIPTICPTPIPTTITLPDLLSSKFLVMLRHWAEIQEGSATMANLLSELLFHLTVVELRHQFVPPHKTVFQF